MLTQKQIKFLRKELATAKNPLFFYDGDGDGLASFLLLYRIHREGKSFALRTTSVLDDRFLRKVEEWQPDKIFVLDIPIVTQEFIDKAKKPIFWIDHHPPLDRKNVHYFNPRIKEPDAYIPTSRMAWQVSTRKEDLWIATAGCLADWYMPNFISKFAKKFPQYLPRKFGLARTVFKEKVSELVKLFFFLQKGSSSDITKSVKVLSRINSPDEIFKQETPQGNFLYKRFMKINEKYEILLDKTKKSVKRGKLILFFYAEDQWSFTANLANELVANYPKKVVIIARKKSGKVKCSLRGKNILVPLKEALEPFENSGGGGHPNACGAVIDEEDWDGFLKIFKEKIKGKK